MAYKVRIKPGFKDVVLPGGGLPLDAGEETWLTNAQYESLSPTAKVNVVVIVEEDVDDDGTPDDEALPGLVYIGSIADPIDSDSHPRPAHVGPIYWLCAEGVEPSNALAGDIIWNAE